MAWIGLRWVLTIGLAGCPLALLPEHSIAAGGAFAVDDAEVGAPGECKVESWVATASNGDATAVAAPACVVKLGVPVELGGHLERTRTDGVWGTGGGVRGKVNLIPLADHPFGLGLSAGASWDLITGANTGGFVNVPLTVQLRDDVRVNVNGGWLYDSQAQIGYAFWGAGFEWSVVKPFTVIGEVFGLAGTLPDVEPGDAPAPNAVREPRTQLGLRVTPRDNIDIDLIWGHNIFGENAHWLTLGLNLRF